MSAPDTSATTSARPPGAPPGTVAWLEIDREALRSNVRAFLGRQSPGAKLMVVVKADAYGHGASIVAPAALQAGASWLGVWTLDEGAALRRVVAADAPILILGHCPSTDFAEALAHDLRLTIYNPEAVEALSAAARASGRHGAGSHQG